MKVGIIGMGNMGTAFARAFIEAGVETMASTPRPDQSELKDKIEIIQDNKTLVKASDIIFFAVKPQILNSVLREIESEVDQQLFVSMAAGRTISSIEGIMGEVKLIRIMPNTPVAIAQGMTAYVPNQLVTQEDIEHIEALLTYTGNFIRLDEDEIDIFGAISGSLPAFIAMVVEAISDGATLEGMKRDKSYRIISQTLEGIAKLQLETGAHPGELKDQVTSPAGSTIEGVRILENAAIRGAFIEAIRSTVSVNRKLGKD